MACCIVYVVMYFMLQANRGRTLLHLLGATGNTEGYLAVLRALDAAGLRAECRQFMSEADRVS